MDRPRRESRQHDGITLRDLSQLTFATKSAPSRRRCCMGECPLSGNWTRTGRSTRLPAMPQSGHYPSHRCARAKEGGSDCHSSKRQRNCCADGPCNTVQNRRKLPISRPAEKDQSPTVQGDTRRKKLRTRTSNSSSVVLWNGPVFGAAAAQRTLRMYAQIMVKVGHFRPAVMAMVLRLEGSQADMRHHSSDVCCRG